MISRASSSCSSYSLNRKSSTTISSQIFNSLRFVGSSSPTSTNGTSGYAPAARNYYYPDGTGYDSRWSDGNTGYGWKQRSLDESREMAVDYMTNVTKRTPIHDGVRMKAKQSQAALYTGDVKNRYRQNVGASSDKYGLYRMEKESPASIVEEASRLSASSLATDTEEMLDNNDFYFDDDYDDYDDDDNKKNLLKRNKNRDGSVSTSVLDNLDFDKLLMKNKMNNEESDEAEEDDDDDDLDLLDENEFGDILNSLRNIPKEDLQMLGQEMYGEASEAADEARDKMLANWFKLRSTRAQHTIFAAGLEEERNMWTPWYLKNEGRK